MGKVVFMIEIAWMAFSISEAAVNFLITEKPTIYQLLTLSTGSIKGHKQRSKTPHTFLFENRKKFSCQYLNQHNRTLIPCVPITLTNFRQSLLQLINDFD
jgi:hypothetical protein